MNARQNFFLIVVSFVTCLAGGVGLAQASGDAVPLVAGLAPWERPAGAPSLIEPPAVDKKMALYGVSTPLPQGLSFMEHQGAWYTPFTRPGMPPPYDLRGWHSDRGEAGASGQKKK